MHGRVKVRTTAEQEALKKIERAKKLAQYRKCIGIVFQKRKDEVWDNELLSITESMLLRNPDIYTLWNIRREVFQNNAWNEEEYTEILEKELILTEHCLRENPKSYSAWYQRCWVTKCMREPNWKRELALCAKCLNLDERNFHCWDYRQYVVQKAEISDDIEFEFSTQKILSNFSNYSSWHYRSKILTKMFHNDTMKLIDKDKIHKEELKLVMDATFTDPNDSSAWFYQRWLLGTDSIFPTLWRILITKDVATIVFDKHVSIERNTVKLFIDDNNVDMQWESYNGPKYAQIWFSKFVQPLQQLATVKDISIIFNETAFNLYYSHLKEAWLYKADSALSKCNKNQEQLSEQLKCYKDLVEMEPNNKWALLTSILLMKQIDFVKYHDVILETLNNISKIDTLRSNYYGDLRSKYLLEYILHNTWQEENKLEMQLNIDLTGLDLTMLHGNQYFSFFEEVNFDKNKLGNSLCKLSTLQQCKHLCLSNNELTCLKQFPKLQNLKVLSLKDNKLTNLDEILDVIKKHNLEKIDLRGNPIADNANINSYFTNIPASLEICFE